MERLSFNLAVPAVLAILFVLCFATAPVLGKVTTSSSEEMSMPVGYKMMLEEMAGRRAQWDIYQSSRRNQKTKMMITKPMNVIDAFEASRDNTLQCVAAGAYCNTIFGPRCCSSVLACIPPGIIGGVCVA